MWSEKDIEEYLMKNSQEKRFVHILGVVDTSEKLAEFYGEDIQKARLAAYLHDLAKSMESKDLISLIEANGYELSQEDKDMPELLHGLAGGILGEKIMEIKDEEVFNAARYHTTGRVGMNLLEKIVFLADYIEPNRSFPGVEEIRELAYKDIDEALLRAFDNTIVHVIKKGRPLHSRTIRSRNYLLKNKL